MKQLRHRARFRVQAGEVCSLVKITPVTRERQIRESIISPVLFCDNVLDVKDDEWLSALRQMTVFTDVPRAFSNRLPKRRVH
jgi:hypothetical protein